MITPLRLLFQNRAGRAVAVGFLVNSLAFGSWASRIPEIQTHTGLGERALGFALMGLPIGAITAAVLLGRLVDLRGPGRVLVIGGIAALIASVGPALAVGGISLWLSAFVFGLANGAVGVAMNVGAVAVEEQLGQRVIASCHGLFSVGAAGGALVGAAAASAALPPAVHLGLVAIFGAGAVAASWKGAQQLPKVPAAGRPPLLAIPRGPLTGLAIVALCVHTCESAMADWSAVYLRNELGATAAVAGLGFAAYSLAMAAGRLLGDPLAERLGPTTLVRSGAFAAAAGMLMAAATNSPAVALVGFACVGIGLSGAFPAVLRAAGGARGFTPGVGVAAVSGAAFVGSVAQPPSIGFLAESIGLPWALALLGGLAIVAALLAPRAFARVAA